MLFVDSEGTIRSGGDVLGRIAFDNEQMERRFEGAFPRREIPDSASQREWACQKCGDCDASFAPRGVTEGALREKVKLALHHADNGRMESAVEVLRGCA